MEQLKETAVITCDEFQKEVEAILERLPFSESPVGKCQRIALELSHEANAHLSECFACAEYLGSKDS